jgi:hypothetical protein
MSGTPTGGGTRPVPYIDLTGLIVTGQQTNMVLTAILGAIHDIGTLSPGTMSNWIEGAGFVNAGSTITNGWTAAVQWQGPQVNALGTIAGRATIEVNSGTIEVTGVAGTLTGGTNISITGADTINVSGTIPYANLPASADIATVPFSLIGPPASGQIFPVTLTQAGTLLANGGTPQAYVGTDPTSTAHLTIETIHSGTVVTQGTVTISTAGSVTWPTFSAVSMAAGDTAAITNQATADATLANLCLSVQFQKT